MYEAQPRPHAVACDRISAAELGGGVDDQAAVPVVERGLEQSEKELLQVVEGCLGAGYVSSLGVTKDVT